MPAKLLVAASAAAALAFGSPAAQADPPTYGCREYTVRTDPLSSTYEGVLVGYAVHAGDSGVSIRCYVTVNGVEVSTTPTTYGPVAVWHVSYSATEYDDVSTCAEVTTTHGTSTSCARPSADPFPPDWVWDLVIGVLVDYVDPALCSVLSGLAGTYGPVTVNTQGDVYVDGEPQWDCPPYDIWPPAG